MTTAGSRRYLPSSLLRLVRNSSTVSPCAMMFCASKKLMRPSGPISTSGCVVSGSPKSEMFKTSPGPSVRCFNQSPAWLKDVTEKEAVVEAMELLEMMELLEAMELFEVMEFVDEWFVSISYAGAGASGLSCAFAENATSVKSNRAKEPSQRGKRFFNGNAGSRFN